MECIFLPNIWNCGVQSHNSNCRSNKTFQAPFLVFQVGKAEFLGRAVGKPSVNLCEADYQVPSLEWFQIYRGNEEAGELLATFEMFEVRQNIVSTFFVKL